MSLSESAIRIRTHVLISIRVRYGGRCPKKQPKWESEGLFPRSLAALVHVARRLFCLTSERSRFQFSHRVFGNEKAFTIAVVSEPCSIAFGPWLVGTITCRYIRRRIVCDPMPDVETVPVATSLRPRGARCRRELSILAQYRCSRRAAPRRLGVAGWTSASKGGAIDCSASDFGEPGVARDREWRQLLMAWYQLDAQRA